ncbi:MAG: transposase, partial [Phycisphaerae bacterium]
VPVRMDLTDANGEEREVLEAHLQPDHVYVMDRGYAKFALFKGILDVGSSFVCRVRKRSGHNGRGGPKQGETILIATDLLDVPPEVIALIYKHRWAIETFFRFFKHVLGCRHLLSHSPNGIEIQTYLGIIACLLIALWTGRKPTLRTYEMICHYFTGLASEEELLAHIEKRKPQS